MRIALTLVVAVAVTASAGCGDQQSSSDEPTPSPATTALDDLAGGTPSPQASDPMTTEGTTTPSAPTQERTSVLETRLVTDLAYIAADDRFSTESGLIDVIAPTEGGPWPTVVVFHGAPYPTKTWHRPDATEIAGHGRVVFLPNWSRTTLSDDAASLGSTWDVIVQQAVCAVTFAAAHTEEYGGDPDHITLYGLSWGGNAVLMAGLSGSDPLETCVAPGPTVVPQALVPIDADWVLGGSWDAQLSENPEAFYSITPWRHLDGSPNLPIFVMVTEDRRLVRPVDPDPATSWLSYRHPDIDLPADLESRGFLDDGMFSMVESGEYAHQVLVEAGYDATLVSMPGAQHEGWGEEGTRAVVETVLRASAAGDGQDP